MSTKQLVVVISLVALVSAGLGVVITNQMGPREVRVSLDLGGGEPFDLGSLGDLEDARIRTNENAAIATLRYIGAAQQQLQSACAIDTDGDGRGEFGYFAEMAGIVPLRIRDESTGSATLGTDPDDLLDPPFLPMAFGDVVSDDNGHGVIQRQGYAFKLYLAGPTVDEITPGIAESVDGGAWAEDLGTRWSSLNAEVSWCAYAWPADAGTTGNRAFFINQEGEIIETANGRRTYSGTASPTFDAALRDESPGDMLSPMATRGATANDGLKWSTLGTSEVETDAETRDPETSVPTERDMDAGPFASARARANESAAISMLRAITSAQAQTRASQLIDADGDAAGEYAYFAEMAGAVPVRGPSGPGEDVMNPPVLSRSFGDISAAGNAERNGYFFRVYLPAATDGDTTAGIAETGGGGCGPSGPFPDPDNAELLWCAYAWPIEAGKTGTRAFFTNQEGEVLQTANSDHAYSGENGAPDFDAALSGESPGDMLAPLTRRGGTANDGRDWTSID